MLEFLASQTTDTTTSMGGLVVGLIFYVVQAVALMTIAQKTNTENGWFAWVPILNLVLMAQIIDMPLIALLLFLVPCVNFFVGLWMWGKIAEKRGKPFWLGILMIIPVVGFFIPLYIAYSD